MYAAHTHGPVCARAHPLSGVQVAVPSQDSMLFSDRVKRHFATSILQSSAVLQPSTSPDNLSTDMTEVRSRLENSRIFESLGSKDLDTLSMACGMVSFSKGDIIFRQGTAAEMMMIVHSGAVSMHRAENDVRNDLDLGSLGQKATSPPRATRLARRRC